MEQTSIYLLAEALVNVNLRANESTNVFLLFTIFSYFFFVIITAYLIRKLHLIARIISATIAIFLNLIMILQIQSQVLIGKVLLNGLSKLAAEGEAPMFKENLIEQGVEPGAELSVIDPNQVKIFIIILFIIGAITPIYLYIFANWEKD
tara:strand:+ start:121 stop:567 length:447 start_codon:yes stop_codon:yes gene_type:complete